MGIFSRVRDIVASNVSAMLDRAEDPEKLIRLMIQEMEDALVEVKASCAGAIASKKRVARALDEARARAEDWGGKAELAVEKGREDLAREALVEKRRYHERVESLENELVDHEEIIGQYKSEIEALEEKLVEVRERQRVMIQRHIHAQKKLRAEQGIRKADGTDAFVRFERLQGRVDRIEAEADLVNFGRKPSVKDQIDALVRDEGIERELEALKSARKGATPGERNG